MSSLFDVSLSQGMICHQPQQLQNSHDGANFALLCVLFLFFTTVFWEYFALKKSIAPLTMSHQLLM